MSESGLNFSNTTIQPSRKNIILIVDDNEFGRDILKRLLITKGYQLAFAANGIEALAKATELTPDLILLDIMMPGIDGYEVCRRLRKDPVLADVPIIMLTALDEPQARMKGIEAGADDFITKPFDRDELRARVQTIIRLNRFRRLIHERAKFEWVIENADDGYVITDLNDQIVYTNSRAKLFLNLQVASTPSSEPADETFLELVTRQYSCQPPENWREWPVQSDDLPSGTPTRYLLRPESEVAAAFWLQVEILNMAEAESDFIIRLRDVSEQMNTEKDMRGFHELVRHKMSTPVLLMLQNLEFLAKYAPRMTNEQMTEAAAKALKNGQRLRSQVKGVLRYLDASQQRVVGHHFAINQLPDMVEKIQAALTLQPVQILGQNGQEALQTTVSRDSMEIVLGELLENSKKFHPQNDPKIVVYVTPISDSWVSIKVCDDGLHLSPDQLKNALTPYYQGEKYFTGEVGGMGLGLASVATLVRAVEGTVNIKNRKNSPGVEIELTLPIEPLDSQH